MSYDFDEERVEPLEANADPLGRVFYPVVRQLFDEESQFVRQLERKLAESRIAETVELYLARAFGIGVVNGLFLWFAGIALGYGLFATGFVEVEQITPLSISNETLLWIIENLRDPFLVLVTGLVFGTIGFGLGFGAMVWYPFLRASSRRREINMLLPDAVSYMYALSVGGLNQLEILESIAQAEDTYGEVAREFRVIVQETEYFDTDYRTAIRNQALQTPSDDLGQFLTDMISIIDSGGNMTRFLEEKKHKHLRTAKQEQEQTLDALEMLGEVYITLSLFPLLLIIVLVIMSMLGSATDLMLYLTVYGIIPSLGAAFLVLVATIKEDEFGDGYIVPDEEESEWLQAGSSGGIFGDGLIGAFTGKYYVFDRIERNEGTYQTVQILKQPHVFFRDNPLFTLAITVPTGAVLVAVAIATGAAPATWSGMVAAPVQSTLLYVYVPAFVVFVPLAVFREWNVRSRRAILRNLSDDLLKLATVNDTGMTVLEAIGTVADTSRGKLADEFQAIYRKVNYGMSLKESLIEFNNQYHIPRLARTVKLIAKAQEASSKITAVLSTAAQASENQDDIERERRSRTRMQVTIVLMTYLTLLGVMAILKTQFLDVMADLNQTTATGSTAFGGSVDTNLLSLMFFHALTIQAILSGFISGYLREANVLAGLKYVISLLVVALAVWMVVG